MKDKILGGLNILIMLGTFMYIGARSGIVSAGWTDSFFGLFIPLLSAVLVYAIHLILHEAGHLVAGLMTGYKFVSFRVGSLILIKNREGKLELKRMTVLGTGGQCLLCPPDVPTEECPYKLYHLMGGLTNLVIGCIGLILSIIFPKGMLNFCLFETSAVLGFMIAITNLMPAKINGMQNDGYNLIDLGRNQFAKKAMNLVLSLNALLTVADSYDDLPEELVNEIMSIDFTKEDLSNASIANAFNYQASLLFVRGDYKKAYETQKYISENDDILEIFRNEARCECLFYEIITEAGTEVIEERYNKALQKYIKATEIYPSRQRLMYAYYRLYKKDDKKAEECMKKLEKMIDTYSVRADAILELETARKIDIISATLIEAKNTNTINS